jgi:lysozyme
MIPDRLKKRLIAVAGAGALAIAGVLVDYFEGRQNVPYQDPGGVWTVCEGHTSNVTPGRQYSDAECDALKAQDLAKADAAVQRLVKVPLTDAQRAALIDFTFNLGEGALAGSTLLKRLNAGDYAGACDEYSRWVNAKVNGKLQPLPSLVTRREAEEWLCLQ